MNDEQQLAEIRDLIDAIDQQIQDLLNARAEAAQEVARIKLALDPDAVFYRPEREAQVLRMVKQRNKGPLDAESVALLFREIMSACLALELPLKVAYLGPAGTFTQAAAQKHFGHAVNTMSMAAIPDVFQEVESGSCHYGVVPVENSIEGAVNYTLDLFFESDLKICAEIYHAISHDLLSKTGPLENVKVIYSHPHAFAQCRHWLKKNLPAAALIECSSTAEAARKASRETGAAAISSREAADSYKLEPLAARIEDVSRNVTRFLVIGKDAVDRTGSDKTSIMFVTAHVPGALYKVLQPIAEADINMVKLESRPTKHENWHYFFFVDLEGHIKDPIVSATVNKMKNLCFYLKLLGSYPRVEAGSGRKERA